MNKKIVAILCSVVTAMIIIGGAFFILNQENKIFKNISFVYKAEQYLASYTDEAVEASFLFVDSTGYIENITNGSAKLRLLTADDIIVNIDSYDISALEKPSLLSAYNLYKISVDFSPGIKEGEVIEYKSLQINENEYDIGNLTIEGCKNIEFPNVNIGTSPFSENTENFTLIITNNENSEITVESVKYMINGDIVNGITENISVLGNQEKDLSFYTEGFSSQNVTIKPLITYIYDGKEYTDIPLVATEYTTDLSKDDIKKYIEENRNIK